MRPHSYTNARYLWHFCQTSDYWAQISEGAVQSTIQNVNAERYGVLRVPDGDPAQQKDSVTDMDASLSAMKVATTALAQAQGLIMERQQALITAAVTGEFDVTTARGVA